MANGERTRAVSRDISLSGRERAEGFLPNEMRQSSSELISDGVLGNIWYEAGQISPS
jgi:hypothetical protein